MPIEILPDEPKPSETRERHRPSTRDRWEVDEECTPDHELAGHNASWSIQFGNPRAGIVEQAAVLAAGRIVSTDKEVLVGEQREFEGRVAASDGQSAVRAASCRLVVQISIQSQAMEAGWTGEFDRRARRLIRACGRDGWGLGASVERPWFNR